MAADASLDETRVQLEEVTELLKASPGDEALLSLKADLEELLALTGGASTEGSVHESTGAASVSGGEEGRAEEPTAETALGSAAKASDPSKEIQPTEPPKKKLKKLKNFEVPPHLVPLDGDTEAEKNRKRRAIKALKSKWRERKKEVESAKKQQTWQNFQQKKKRKDKSIFSTNEGVEGRVGVSAGRNITGFGERKRHKHA